MDETSSSASCLAVVDNNRHAPPPTQKPGGCVGIFFHLFDWNRRFAKRKLFSKKLLPPPARTEHPPSVKFAADEKMPKSKPHLVLADGKSGGYPKKNGSRSCTELQKKQEMRPPSLVAKLMGLDAMPAASVQRDKQKVESLRPQKLQKTGGQSDVRKAVTEALQIRNVLLSSRKQHSHYSSGAAKLANPTVKSPKFARHASRTSKLIDAATRILEPGLQATQRAKSAIAYSNSMRYQESNVVTSCNNCGNLVDVVVESRPSSLASHFANQGRDHPAACKRKQGGSDAEMEEKALRGSCSEVAEVGVVDRPAMPLPREIGARFLQEGGQPREETSPCAGLKQRSQGKKTMSIGNNILSNIESSRTKDFVAMNRSLSGRSSRPRVSNMERKFINRRDDGLPPLRRKRRIDSVNAQLERSGLCNSTMSVRHRNINVDAVSAKETGVMGVNTSPVRTRSGVQGGGNIGGVAPSFTFSSPSRPKSGQLMDDRRNVSDQRTQVVDDCRGKRSVQKQELPQRDALGALIQEKLKELICQEENEGGNGQHPIRSTASILQELISALTIEQLTSPHSNFPNLSTPLQKGRKFIGSSVGFSHDSDHLSPGSVLDASFSTESCISSSLDDNSVCRLLRVDTSHDIDQWDSVILTSEGRTFPKLVTNMLDHISRILQSITLAGGCCQWPSRDLSHAKETILTSELLFGSHSPDRVRTSVLGHFLLDELNALSIHIRPDGNNHNQLKRLLFDTVIEWLDSRCRKYSDSGYRTCRQPLPLQWCTRLVIEEVGAEMKRWTSMAGMIPDEIVEPEIGQSVGRWTEFEMESYEIGRDIVDVLLEETVRELWL
ncbi:hypothetical protein LINGRAHAP2_LOCUS18596 [Linum grandiflorum]